MADREVRLIDANKLLEMFCTDCKMSEGSYSDNCRKECVIYNTIITCPTVIDNNSCFSVKKKPTREGYYPCLFSDDKGIFIDIGYWNPTFGGRWQCVFDGEDSFSDVSNVIAWQCTQTQPIKYAHRTLNVGLRSYCSNCGALAYCENFCSHCGAYIIKEGESQ